MMKRIFFPLFILLFLGVGNFSMAQNPDTKLTTGVVAYQQQDFAKAMEALNFALEDPTALKEKNQPKGFYYRGLTRLGYMQQLGAKIAIAGQDADPATVLSEDETAFMQNAVLGAYEDFKNAKKYDVADKWGKKIDQQTKGLSGMILNGGAQILNGTFGKDLKDEEKKVMYAEVIKYMDAVTELSPNMHLAYDFKGQSYLNSGDTANAYASFSKAAEVFNENEPRQPDQLIAYVYYRKALIERYSKNDLDAALASLEAGKPALDKEHDRYLKIEGLQPAQIENINSDYTNAKEQISRFELDILLNSPGKLQQALDKFEKATAEEPDNYIIHVAYAQLLEKFDLAKAEEVYKTATKIDPGKQIAWFNLGALYVNKGVEAYKKANEEDDMEKARALQKEGNDAYTSAFPYLEKSLEIEKCDRQSLDAIISICINLGDDYTASYKKYKDMKAECGF